MASKRGARIHQIQAETDLEELEKDFSVVARMTQEGERDRDGDAALLDPHFDVILLVQGSPFKAHKVDMHLKGL